LDVAERSPPLLQLPQPRLPDDQGNSRTGVLLLRRLWLSHLIIPA
jgi:hypothetical protein